MGHGAPADRKPEYGSTDLKCEHVRAYRLEKADYDDADLDVIALNVFKAVLDCQEYEVDEQRKSYDAVLTVQFHESAVSDHMGIFYADGPVAVRAEAVADPRTVHIVDGRDPLFATLGYRRRQ